MQAVQAFEESRRVPSEPALDGYHSPESGTHSVALTPSSARQTQEEQLPSLFLRALRTPPLPLGTAEDEAVSSCQVFPQQSCSNGK
jgi:hypothetical protein